MTAKTRIALDIECGKVTCQDCDWLDAGKDDCLMFSQDVTEEHLRCAPCLAAQERAEDMMFKVAAAKAAAQGEGA